MFSCYFCVFLILVFKEVFLFEAWKNELNSNKGPQVHCTAGAIIKGFFVLSMKGIILVMPMEAWHI